MKLSDLIKKADGLREDAFMNRGLVTRMKEDHSLENISFDVKQVFQFALQRDLQLSPADAQFKLAHFDQVYVRKAPGYGKQGTF